MLICEKHHFQNQKFSKQVDILKRLREALSHTDTLTLSQI